MAERNNAHENLAQALVNNLNDNNAQGQVSVENFRPKRNELPTRSLAAEPFNPVNIIQNAGPGFVAAPPTQSYFNAQRFAPQVQYVQPASGSRVQYVQQAAPVVRTRSVSVPRFAQAPLSTSVTVSPTAFGGSGVPLSLSRTLSQSRGFAPATFVAQPQAAVRQTDVRPQQRKQAAQAGGNFLEYLFDSIDKIFPSFIDQDNFEKTIRDQQERRRYDEEARRAEQERRRAEQERRRAEEEAFRRAEEERRRLEEELARRRYVITVPANTLPAASSRVLATSGVSQTSQRFVAPSQAQPVQYVQYAQTAAPIQGAPLQFSVLRNQFSSFVQNIV